MNRSLRKVVELEGTDSSQPSEAWLFAQQLLGKPVPTAASAAAQSRAECVRLEWLAQISPEHALQLRRQRSDEAEARRQQELLEWVASISRHCTDDHCGAVTAHEAWDPTKHPRGGDPANRGRFSNATSSSQKSARPVNDSTSQSTVAKGEFGPSGVPSTKSHLPADHRGTWLSGTRGEGTFLFNDCLENQQAGIVGTEIRFDDGRIAVGGFPPEAYYKGSADKAGVNIDVVTGGGKDGRAADAQMRIKEKNPEWQRPAGYRWNHAGREGSRTIELVDERFHTPVAHKGPGAEPRAQARARGSTGRAMGALTIYLAVRDVLQAAGFLQPTYTVEDREIYHFRAEDGSVFIVNVGGWFSSPERQYVAGPRKGQTERITAAEVEEYRTLGEREFGKYIPGGLITGPRFIPGKQRATLPYTIYKLGIPYNGGWIDEKGIHYNSFPEPLPI